MTKPHVIIISPALAKANNGNWQTAFRWACHLRNQYSVSVQSSDDTVTAKTVPTVAIALHARRSAQALAAIAASARRLRTALVLTGTDLYRDIKTDSAAQRSLQIADRLVVLQDAGLQELDANLRKKSTVIFQSAATLRPLVRTAARRYFDVAMIGHLREEKDPATFIAAAPLITCAAVRLTHIGGALDAVLGTQALTMQQQCARYRWLGSLPHAKARQQLKRCDLMVITSKMEGGANVIIEAVTSGVPVLASDISGNRGMLGDDYAGYFQCGDTTTLAKLIDRVATDQAFHTLLQEQCAARAPLFAPEREKAAVLQLVDNLFHL